MTPRDDLTELLCYDVANADDPVEEAALRLEKWAIGRWVPVSERLPEVTGKYLVKLHCKNIAFVEVTETSPFFTDGIDQTEITSEFEWSHWLELDLPKEEAK